MSPSPDSSTPRSHANQYGGLPEWRKHDLVMHELLDAIQGCFASLPVHLDGLFSEEPIDVGIASVDIGAAGSDEVLDPYRRVTEAATAGVDEIPKLLVGESLNERRSLERAKFSADADGRQVIDEKFGTGEGGVAEEFAGVESVRVASRLQQLSGLAGIVRGRGRLPEELERAGNDAPREPQKAEHLRLIISLAVERVTRGQAHAPVVPV